MKLALSAARAALLTTVPLAALVVGGCANALTFSESERLQGRVALEEGDYETAAGIFAEHVRANPRDYKSHAHLGQARLAAGNAQAALRSFSTALETMRLSERSRNDEMYRQLIVEEYARALAEADADGALVLDVDRRSKGDLERKLIVAKASALTGRPDAAIEAYEAARQLDRRDAYVAKSYGLYLESIRQDDAAEAMLAKAYALDTGDQEVAAALQRLGIVPGPALLSSNDLARPKLPLGPLPQVRLVDPDGEPDKGPAIEPFDPELN